MTVDGRDGESRGKSHDPENIPAFSSTAFHQNMVKAAAQLVTWPRKSPYFHHLHFPPIQTCLTSLQLVMYSISLGFKTRVNSPMHTGWRRAWSLCSRVTTFKVRQNPQTVYAWPLDIRLPNWHWGAPCTLNNRHEVKHVRWWSIMSESHLLLPLPLSDRVFALWAQRPPTWFRAYPRPKNHLSAANNALFLFVTAFNNECHSVINYTGLVYNGYYVSLLFMFYVIWLQSTLTQWWLLFSMLKITCFEQI